MGEEMIYRGPTKSDLDGYLSFINELAGENTYIKAEKQTRKKERKWLDGQLKAIRKRDTVMVLAEAGGKLVGNCGIARRAAYRRVRHSAVFGISVLKKWRGRGIGETLARKAIARAKKRMNIGLLTLSVMANNPVAQKLYRKLGFREFGRCPKAFWFKGKYVDEIYMYKSL